MYIFVQMNKKSSETTEIKAFTYHKVLCFEILKVQMKLERKIDVKIWSQRSQRPKFYEFDSIHFKIHFRKYFKITLALMN